MYDKFAHTNNLSRYWTFFGTISLNLAKSVLHLNSALPMIIQKNSLFTHTYVPSYIYHVKFWAFSTFSFLHFVSDMLFSRIKWDFFDYSPLMSSMVASHTCLFQLWKLPGKLYNVCHLSRVLSLASDLNFQNLGHLVEEVSRFHIFMLKGNKFFDYSSGLSIR